MQILFAARLMGRLQDTKNVLPRKRKDVLEVLIIPAENPPYLVACTSGAGAGAAWISWNCGSGRRPGGLASLVQQQEAASIAKAETTSAERMRIMEWVALLVGEESWLDTDDWGLFGGSHIGRLARSGCPAGAAGSGEKRGSRGDQGDFHR